jgi:ABC-type polysaccharide/polyol phosphate transport system ATPase subunit
VRAISQRVMWVDRGVIQVVGAADEVCDAYLHALGR